MISLGNAAGTRSRSGSRFGPKYRQRRARQWSGNAVLRLGRFRAGGLHGHVQRRQHAGRGEQRGDLPLGRRQPVAAGRHFAGSALAGDYRQRLLGQGPMERRERSWAAGGNWKDTIGGGPSGRRAWATPPTPRPSAVRGKRHDNRDAQLGRPPAQQPRLQQPQCRLPAPARLRHCGLTLAGTGGSSPAALTVTSGTHAVATPSCWGTT